MNPAPPLPVAQSFARWLAAIGDPLIKVSTASFPDDALHKLRRAEPDGTPLSVVAMTTLAARERVAEMLKGCPAWASSSSR